MKVMDEVYVRAGKGKVIFLQKLKWEHRKRLVEYRFTYYMIGVKPGAKGRWVFGQYSLIITPSQLKLLLSKASAKGWAGVKL